MIPLKTLQWRSIRFGLTRVFVLFLLMIMFLGLFAMRELGAVNRVSSEVRDRWLQSTRVLGDLNNYTSDSRAAEGTRLLAQTPQQKGEIDRQIVTLSNQVQQADHAYRQIPHDQDEQRLYSKFWRAWLAYQATAARGAAMSRRPQLAAATALYMTDSMRAYAAASDALGVLTNRTVAKAALASDKALTTYNTARALIILVILAAGVSLIAAVNYISRHITGPILNLAAGMRALAANNMSIEIEGESRRDEIGEMARAVAVFRSNAVELAHSQRGLIQQASMLAERLEAEQALTTLQRNFVSMASHEFRTPLTIIDGHAQRLISLQSRLAPEDIAARAGRIRKAVRQMTVLIEQLLNSSRILDGQTSGLYFHPTDVDLTALLAEVCALYREISPDAQIMEQLAEQPIHIHGDPNLLHQLFGNILSNSIKYSPAGGCIKITCTRADYQFFVNIEDQGIGIPAQDIDRIFERYHRGINVSGIVGTGVGLYIVRIVAELHGGEVAVTSQEGRGACFTVRLPL